MKKNIIIIVISILFIILVSSSIIFYSISLKGEDDLYEKADKELEYVSNQLIAVLGQFNGLAIGDYALQLNVQKVSSEEDKKSNKSEVYNKKESDQKNKLNFTNSKSTDSDMIINDEHPKQINQEQNQILAQRGKYVTNWKFIELQIENLYQIWNNISVDLISLDVDKKSILLFSDYLNESTQNIKNKDKKKSMESISKIYSLIAKYRKDIFNENTTCLITFVKAYSVQAYTDITNEKWNEATKKIEEAEKIFKNMINNFNENYGNNTVINQSYIIINELKKSTQLKDKEIFYIQYKNLLSKMQLLS